MNRTTRTLTAASAAVALSAGMFAAAQPAHAGTGSFGTVTARTLVGRLAPTTRATRIPVAETTVLRKGVSVALVCKVHGQTVAGNDLWYQVFSPSTDAWISARYVRNKGTVRWCTGNNQPVTTTKAVVVRQAPSTNSPVIRTVKKGVRMTAVCMVPNNDRHKLGWYYTTDGNWIHGAGVTSRGPIAPCH